MMDTTSKETKLLKQVAICTLLQPTGYALKGRQKEEKRLPHGGIARNFEGRKFPYAAVTQRSGLRARRSARKLSCIIQM